MAKFMSGNDRRESTIKRHNTVHEVYEAVIKELGDVAGVVSKQYIYERIRDQTGLCLKTIAYVVNHTEKVT